MITKIGIVCYGVLAMFLLVNSLCFAQHEDEVQIDGGSEPQELDLAPAEPRVEDTGREEAYQAEQEKETEPTYEPQLYQKLPDLTVKQVTAHANKVSAQIYNIGEDEARGIKVSFYKCESRGSKYLRGQKIADRYIEKLSFLGGQNSVWVFITGPDLTKGPVMVVVDPDKNIKELNENNNSLVSPAVTTQPAKTLKE